MNTTRGATAFSCMMRAASTIAIASFFVVPSYAQGTANLSSRRSGAGCRFRWFADPRGRRNRRHGAEARHQASGYSAGYFGRDRR